MAINPAFPGAALRDYCVSISDTGASASMGGLLA